MLVVDIDVGVAAAGRDDAHVPEDVVGQAVPDLCRVVVHRVEVDPLEPQEALIVHVLVELDLHRELVAEIFAAHEAVVEAAVGPLEAEPDILKCLPHEGDVRGGVAL